jgi:hypothetical protein
LIYSPLAQVRVGLDQRRRAERALHSCGPRAVPRRPRRGRGRRGRVPRRAARGVRAPGLRLSGTPPPPRRRGAGRTRRSLRPVRSLPGPANSRSAVLHLVAQWGGAPGDESAIVCVDPDSLPAAAAAGGLAQVGPPCSSPLPARAAGWSRVDRAPSGDSRCRPHVNRACSRVNRACPRVNRAYPLSPQKVTCAAPRRAAGCNSFPAGARGRGARDAALRGVPARPGRGAGPPQNRQTGAARLATRPRRAG